LHLSGFRLKLLGLSPSILLFSQCFGKNFVIEIGAMAGRHLICESIALAVLFCAELLIGLGIRRPGASRAAQLLDCLVALDASRPSANAGSPAAACGRGRMTAGFSEAKDCGGFIASEGMGAGT